MALRRVGLHRLATAAALILIGAAPLFAQTFRLPGEKNSTADEPVDIRYERFERTEENGQITYILTGKAEIFKPSMSMKADSIVGWQTVQPSKNGGKSRLAFDEVYAEGHVRILRGREKIAAERVYFDYRTGRGLMIDGEIRTKKADIQGNKRAALQGSGDPFLQKLERGYTEMPLVIRAKRFRQLDAKTIVAEDGNFTTCEFGDPDFRVNVKEATILKDPQGSTAALRHIIPTGGGLPVLYVPYYFLKPGQASILQNIRPMNSTRFGYAVRVAWGLELTRYKRDANGEIMKDSHGLPEVRRWGNVILDTDWLSKRGFGVGPGIEYAWESYEGFVQGYYIHDTANDLASFDKTVLPFDNDDRGRLHTFHRQWLFNDKLRIDLESSFISDRNFLRTYFEKEALEGKEQETYAYLRYLNQNVGAFMLDRWRLNDFQNQVEYLPQFEFKWNSEPLLDGHVTYTNSTEISHVKYRFDDALHLDDPVIFRADSTNTFTAPIDVGPVLLTPWAGVRETQFSQGAHTSDSIERSILSSGVRAFFQMHRESGTSWDLVGLRGLRHTVEVEARYENNWAANEAPGDLIPMDEVEQAGKFEDVYLELRNRFSTHGAGGANDTFEFLNLGIAIKEYPYPERDTGHFDAQDYLPPMSWLSLTADSKGNYDERNFSNLVFDWDLSPRSFFRLYGKSELDTLAWEFATLDTTASLWPTSGLSFYLSDHFITQVTNTLTYGVNWQAGEKWGLRAWQQYDFNKGVFAQQVFGITRDIHDFVIDAEMRYDSAKDDFTVAFMFFPKAAPRLRVQTKALDVYAPQQPSSPQQTGGTGGTLFGH